MLQTSKRGIGRKTVEFTVEPQAFLAAVDGEYRQRQPGISVDANISADAVPLVPDESGRYSGSGPGTASGNLHASQPIGTCEGAWGRP